MIKDCLFKLDASGLSLTEVLNSGEYKLSNSP